MKKRNILLLATLTFLGSTGVNISPGCAETVIKAGDVTKNAVKTISNIHSAIQQKAKSLAAHATPKVKAAINEAEMAAHAGVEIHYGKTVAQFANDVKNASLRFKKEAQDVVSNLHKGMTTGLAAVQKKAETLLVEAAKKKE